MDKILMKTIFSNLKLPQVKYLVFENEDLNDEKVKKKLVNEILKKLNFPVFVKPSNSGSSLGISKVINKSEISQALEKAWAIDPRILVEEGLDVREIECGIIGNSKLLTSEIGEVKYESDWYDYSSKYYSNNKITIPAEIDSKITKKIKEIAIQSCRALNIFGFARVDFFLEKSSNKILLNEINTIPGFTKKSMFPMLWKASGLNIEQLVAKLVDISLDL
jgi:D-alanine-D-alanine ligase